MHKAASSVVRLSMLTLLCVMAMGATPQRSREVLFVQDMVIGLAPGQRGRLTVSPAVVPNFDARAVMLNVFAESGELLATTGRQTRASGALRFPSIEFVHAGHGRRLVKFQYQLAGYRLRTSAASRATATIITPLTPGTLEIIDAGAETARLLLPVAAFRSDGTAASCALPSPSQAEVLSDARGLRRERHDLAVVEFPLLRVGTGQALEFTLADSVPPDVRRGLDLGLIVRVVRPDGELVVEEPETQLDGKPVSVRLWVYGTELPPSAGGPDVGEFVVQYVVTCEGACRRLAGWLAAAQPSGPPINAGVWILDVTYERTSAGMLLPAVQKVVATGDDSDLPPPPPPGPNS
jgi:hypothetical protein